MRAGLSMILGLFALAGCGTGGSTIAPPRVAFTPATPPPKLRTLIGADARALIAQFGTPRLDIREPGARKLQFANGRCILDAYLYPPARDREPLVTHADARLPTGEEVEAQACVKMLQAKAP
jgi:hypothetical protein